MEGGREAFLGPMLPTECCGLKCNAPTHDDIQLISLQCSQPYSSSYLLGRFVGFFSAFEECLVYYLLAPEVCMLRSRGNGD